MQFLRPFDPGEDVALDASWPLASGLIFASTLTDGASGLTSPVRGSREIINGDSLESGLIHVCASPWGHARNRTDATSNFIWPTRERYDFGTGDFTVACYGAYTDQGAVLNAFSNGAGANQWRILVDCDASIAYSSGSVCFWTYDGSVTAVAGAAILGTRTNLTWGRPDWFVGVRRGTTVELWRSGVLIASNTGVARNVTGTATGANKPQLGNGGTCSDGYHGPALIWNRAITPSEQRMFAGADIFPFVQKPPLRYFALSVGGSTFNLTLSATNAPVATHNASVAAAKTITQAQTAARAVAVTAAKAITQAQSASRVVAASAAKSLTQAQTASVSSIKAFLLTLSASAAQSATLARTITTARSLTQASAATIAKTAAAAKSLTQASAATIVSIKAFLLTLSATVGQTAAVGRAVTLARSLTNAGSLTLGKTVTTARTLTQGSSASITAIRAFVLNLSATVASSAALTRQIGALRAATASGAATVARAVAATRSVVSTGAATIAKSTPLALSATVSFVASIVATATSNIKINLLYLVPSLARLFKR